MGGGAEVAFGADRIGDEQVPAVVEVSDFLVGVAGEGGFEQPGGFGFLGGIGGECEGLVVEERSGVGAREASDEDEGEEGKNGDVELGFASERVLSGRRNEGGERGGDEGEGGNVELEIEEGEDQVAGEGGAGEGAGRGRFAAWRAGADQFAKEKGCEGEAAEQAGDAGFGVELKRGAVELEDVFHAAVELGAVARKHERGGAGTPAEQRSVVAHEETGVGHGRALAVALGEFGGRGVGVEEQRAGARMGESDGEEEEGSRGADDEELFARQPGVEESEDGERGDGDQSAAAAAGKEHECGEGGGKQPGETRGTVGGGKGEAEEKRQGEDGEAGGVVGVAERVGIAGEKARQKRRGAFGVEEIEQPTGDAEGGDDGEELREAEDEGASAVGRIGLQRIVQQEKRGERAEGDKADEEARALVKAKRGGKKEDCREKGGGERPRPRRKRERFGEPCAGGQGEQRRGGCGPEEQQPRHRVGARGAGIDDGQQENAGDGDETQQPDEAGGEDGGGIAHAFAG